MGEYKHFAALYDKWMQNIDYAEWWHYLATTFSLGAGMRVLEIGCGTGNLTEHMLDSGLTVVASDISTDMLTQAEAKLRHHANCTLLRLDMRRLPAELGSFDAVIASCDVVNYLRDASELTQFALGAKRVLKPGGCLLFDIHGEGRLTEWLLRPYHNRIGENSCYMLHVTSANERITHRLTGFARQQNGAWTRFDELHRQTFFARDAVEITLRGAGFREIICFEFASTTEPNETTLRLQFAAR